MDGATLSEFAELRRAHADFKNLWDKAEGEEKDDLTRAYLTDIERFAVGLNLNAYDIGVLNKMSGGLLVRQWQRYFKPYIEKKRAQPETGRFVSNATLYVETEKMIERLCELRDVNFKEL